MSAAAGMNVRPAPPAPLKSLLANYTTSHPLRSPSPLPPSSRVDPRLTQRTAPATSSSPLLWTIPTWIAFVRFALAKGLHIIWSLISHFLFGPKRKSWGYRMTFITSFMRNVADHTSLADIVLIRRLISLHQIIPLPADAVVTPITFTVPLQTGEKVARGFLRDLDLAETGTRQLSGEWVVGLEVWRRLKRERRERLDAERRKKKRTKSSSMQTEVSRQRGITAGSNALLEEISGHAGEQRRSDSPDVYSEREGSIMSAEQRESPTRERVIYYVHGGAYYVGNAATHRLVTIGISKACNARVFSITYRLAPEHAFPLPLHDVLHGYLRLLAAPLSIPPENIVVMGDSAGGGLSLALCMYLRDEGYKMPSGLVLMSPWVDLTMSCGSWDDCADTDVVPRPEADDHLNPVGCYLGKSGISRYLTHPYASPLFGDLSGLPPMLIQSGDSEVLRDEITLLAHKATLSGTQVTHELYEDMVHVFQMFTWLPAAKAAIASAGRWCRVTLPTIEQHEAERSMGVAHENAYRSGIDQEVDAGAVDAGQPRVVDAAGDDVSTMAPAPADEDEGGRSTPVARTPSRRGESCRSGSSLRLNLDARSARADADLPVVDRDDPSGDGNDNGDEDDSRSATPTPTRSSVRSSTDHRAAQLSASTSSLHRHLSRYDNDHADDADFEFFASPSRASGSTDPPPYHSIPPPQPPRFRRAATSYGGSRSHTATPRGSPPPGDAQSGVTGPRRRRRPTVGTPHMSPSISMAADEAARSNPVSPTPSIRRRLRSPTASFSQQAPPTTRFRSQSHSDVRFLVEGYNEEGAANETVVYAPGGQVRSVGVLGLDEGDEEY